MHHAGEPINRAVLGNLQCIDVSEDEERNRENPSTALLPRQRIEGDEREIDREGERESEKERERER